MKNFLQEIIQRAVDVHVHIGPEIIPRKYTAGSLNDSERGKIAGMVLKNHFYSTMPFIQEVEQLPDLQLFGGLVLNNAVGGLNAEAIYATSLLSKRSFMVWLPTINAEQFLTNSEFELAPEWIKQKNFSARKANNVLPVRICKDGKIVPAIHEVLQMIKKTDSVLATGHISWRESVLIIKQARKIGLKKIIVTHPIYQRIDMPLSVQEELASYGCFIEQSYSMFAIDSIPIEKIVNQIKAVGSQSIILSSDVGQPFSPSPSEALYRFAELLIKNGITEKELEEMLVGNPKKLLDMK